jgi:hypothetical protein
MTDDEFVIRVPTEEELQRMSDENWSRVDPDSRERCVRLLRERIPASQMEQLRDAFTTGTWPVGFHMFGGMAIRNLLREAMPDTELPEVEYDSSHKYRNWDDFYMGALKEAASR